MASATKMLCTTVKMMWKVWVQFLVQHRDQEWYACLLVSDGKLRKDCNMARPCLKKKKEYHEGLIPLYINSLIAPKITKKKTTLTE